MCVVIFTCENLRALRLKSSWAFLKHSPEHECHQHDANADISEVRFVISLLWKGDHWDTYLITFPCQYKLPTEHLDSCGIDCLHPAMYRHSTPTTRYCWTGRCKSAGPAWLRWDLPSPSPKRRCSNAPRPTSPVGNSWSCDDIGARSRYLRQGWVIASHSILWDAITNHYLRYLLLAPKSSCHCWCQRYWHCQRELHYR